MKYQSILFSLLISTLIYGQDCDAADGTSGVQLWDNCYSIENTTYLDLRSSALTGAIPPGLGSLINLTYLDLRFNGLEGQIPNSLRNLANLQHLDLGVNQLSGPIPANLAQLSNLTHFDLGFNQLVGPIPPAFTNMVNLTKLILRNNGLTGSVPEGVGNLANLTHLILNDNALSGEVPQEICQISPDWARPMELSLENNQFCGPYPDCSVDWIGYQDTTYCNSINYCLAPDSTEGVNLWGVCYSIENTTEIDLSLTGIEGNIPPQEIGALVNLTHLDLGINQLTGDIPVEIGNLTNLTYLDLKLNGLRNAIPEEIGNLTNLTYLNLSYNQLNGYMPSQIVNLSNMVSLNFSYNQLIGPIPLASTATGASMPELEILILRNNAFTGPIPTEVWNLTNLRRIDLSNNSLSGFIPNQIGDLTNLVVFKILNNEITGYIPDSFCELNLNFGDTNRVNLTSNRLCPMYPTCVTDYVGDQLTTGCGDLSIGYETLPEGFKLYDAYPNPFNPSTVISYELETDTHVRVTIFDNIGRVVKTLINNYQSSGYKMLQWNGLDDFGRSVSGGIYLYRIEVEDDQQTKKMVLVK